MTTLILLLLGVLFAAIGYHLRLKFQRIRMLGTKTKGVIVDYIEEDSVDENGYSYSNFYPVVEFKVLKGNVIRQKLSISGNRKNLNKKIDIIYLQKGEEFEAMKANSSPENVALFFIVIGVAFILLGFNSIYEFIDIEGLIKKILH